MELKNNKEYQLKKPFKLAEFDVRMLVGTGLHFEIWGKQGVKSKGHEEIEVEWDYADGDEDPKAFRWRNGSAMERVDAGI
jgi:hypothetical protein